MRLRLPSNVTAFACPLSFARRVPPPLIRVPIVGSRTPRPRVLATWPCASLSLRDAVAKKEETESRMSWNATTESERAIQPQAEPTCDESACRHARGKEKRLAERDVARPPPLARRAVVARVSPPARVPRSRGVCPSAVRSPHDLVQERWLRKVLSQRAASVFRRRLIPVEACPQSHGPSSRAAPSWFVLAATRLPRITWTLPRGRCPRRAASMPQCAGRVLLRAASCRAFTPLSGHQPTGSVKSAVSSVTTPPTKPISRNREKTPVKTLQNSPLQPRFNAVPTPPKKPASQNRP